MAIDNRDHRGTSTSSFGVSRRESHDASDFYRRFAAPVISDDSTVRRPALVDEIIHDDARVIADRPDLVTPASVALVVTSPPYFAGKEYEEELGRGPIPATYIEYLDMLTDVFAGCVVALEPGGRIAVNVANLGRKPYRSLAADVIAILQDRLGLLLRGEIVWQKARGAGGSCAWGSFQSPANPVLRDLTERIVVASKGRFDRALSRRQRAEAGLPSEGSIFKDDFMEATTDVWEISPESATRVGHPAPFPVELPQRLIELYTYRNDLVLDPFVGSGTTAVAAVRADRHFLGFDTDAGYVEQSRRRVAEERERLERVFARRSIPRRVVLPAIPEPAEEAENTQARAVREGRKAQEIARAVLLDSGFEIIGDNERLGSGVEVDFVALDQAGRRWHFDVSGAFTSTRAGLRRTDTLWKALGKAALANTDEEHGSVPLVLVTTDLPPLASAGDLALRNARRGAIIFDAVEMLAAAGQERLRLYAEGGHLEPVGDLLPPEDHD